MLKCCIGWCDSQSSPDAQNINAALIGRFKPEGCFISLEGVRLELVPENFYLYPDVFLTLMKELKKISYLKISLP